MFDFFYSIGIKIYGFLIYLYSFKDPKAAKWIEGRQGQWRAIRKNLNPRKKKFWIHCASLGEFEQGRTLIDRLKEIYPDTELVVTFFSPSGYEIRHNYKNADHVFYLPIDSKENARWFIHHVNPRLAVFIKYEYWYFYYKTLNEQNIPLIQVSTTFRADQTFFRWYGKPLRKILTYVDHFFLQDSNSADLLDDLGFYNHSRINDTRFDRVNTMAKRSVRLPFLEKFTAGKAVLIGGSTYRKEEEIIEKIIDNNWDGKVIIAPHQVNRERIEEIAGRFSESYCIYSEIPEAEDWEEKQVMVIDKIGMLGSLYRYGSIAFIGGAFHDHLHNTLEPAAYGLPIIVGPQYHKFREVSKLISKGGAFSISDSGQFIKLLEEELNTEEQREERGQKARKFVKDNTGGTEKVVNHIRTLLPSKKPSKKQGA